MKTILTIALLAISLLAGNAIAQDQNNAVFGGIAYQNTSSEPSAQQGWLVGYGYARHTGPIWIANWIKLGQYGTWQAEVMWFPFSMPYGDGTFWSFGLTAGPGVDWLTLEAGTEPTVYMTTAAGGILTVDVFRFAIDESAEKFANLGLLAYGKYKYKFSESQYHQDGWLVGGAFYGQF